MMKQRQYIAYKKLGKEKESDDSSGEETELFVKKKTPRKEIRTIEKNVEEGDTLQSLAIRYCCTIEDLKRINNIQKGNEIFAKITIKVPHRPFTAALAGVHSNGKCSPNELNEPSTSRLIDIDSLNTKLLDTKSKDKVNEIIFNSSISQISRDRLEETNTGIDEDINLLHQQTQLPRTEPSKINCSGVDGDISWIALFVCIVIVIFAVPLIYVFYIAEHPDEYHHHVS